MKYLLVPLLILLTSFSHTWAGLSILPTKPEIISRAEWGADEQYTSRESSYWKAILASWENYVPPYVDPEIQKKREERSKKAIDYINENFKEENTVTQKISLDPNEGFTLAWPLQYTDYVNAIIVHHTHSEYDDATAGMSQIYKYHSISRGWGDIGYHYVI